MLLIIRWCYHRDKQKSDCGSFIFQVKLLQLYAVEESGALPTELRVQSTFQKERRIAFLLICTPAGARTLDTLIKSQVLYQLSYGCNIISNLTCLQFCCFIQSSFWIAGAKVRSIFESTKLFWDFFRKKAKKTQKVPVLSNICVGKTTIFGFISWKTK